MASDTQAVLFALCAAVSWGLSATFVRLGLSFAPTSLGTLVSLIVGLVMTGALVLSLELEAMLELSLSAALAFGVVGILNFPFGRYMNFLSVQHLGVGRSTSLTSSAPLFGMLFAIIFIGEELTPGRALGAALVLAGVYLTLRSARTIAEPEE